MRIAAMDLSSANTVLYFSPHVKDFLHDIDFGDFEGRGFEEATV